MLRVEEPKFRLSDIADQIDRPQARPMAGLQTTNRLWAFDTT